MTHLFRRLIPALAVVFFLAGGGLFAQNMRALQLGSWASGTIRNGAGEWFTIRAAGTGFLTVETSGDLDTYLEAYDGTGGTLLAEDDDGSDRNNNARVEFLVEPGLSYRILARGYDGDVNGSFRILASFESIPPDSVRNTQRSQAQSLTPGTSTPVLFRAAAESRWFRITVPSGGGNQLVARTQGDLDTLLYLYDNQGKLLMENDDAQDGTNARVSSIASPGTTLYVEVRTYEGVLGRSSLHVEMTEAPRPDRYENDNSLTAAKDIALGERQERTFSGAADEDWARLRITKSGAYEIACSSLGDIDVYLRLYDSNNELISEDDDSGGNYDALISKELYPGTYYIQATTISSEPLADGRYTLQVRQSR
jgi:hypothetical protein